MIFFTNMILFLFLDANDYQSYFYKIKYINGDNAAAVAPSKDEFFQLWTVAVCRRW